MYSDSVLQTHLPHSACIDTRRQIQQTMQEVIAEMERAKLRGYDDQAHLLEGIAWRLIGILAGRLPDKSDRKIRIRK